MIALLVLGLALPLFALVAFGIVASEGYREELVTGHRRTPATRSPRRLTALTVRRVGWLTLAQTCALLAGLVLRAVSQR
ncbi:MAG TPA: hypothetical protein VHO29_00250 [Marmoricola sp.]|nr:hypothetical protein [Marmoricola sp.]